MELYCDGSKKKPKLRGVSHEIFWIVTPAMFYAILLVCKTDKGFLCASIFMICFFLHYAFSSQFHRRNWSRPSEILMGRLDHAGIYLLIGGGYTPVPAFAMANGREFLMRLWILVGAGIITCFFPKPNRYVNFAIGFALGATALPEMPQLISLFTPLELGLQLTGSALGVIGGLVYSFKFPNPVADIFGFHEVFHIFSISASICLYLVNYLVIARYDS